MSRIDITTSAAPLSDGMLQTANPLDATLQVVTDNVGNSSTVSLSTTETQINSILRIKTDNAELLDIENSSGNRFNINRDVQKVNLDFASNPTGSTSIVGAIRTFIDGTNLTDVAQFQENGQVTFTERVKLESDSTVTTQTSSVIQSSTTNSSLVIAPNGTGALIASVPDGTATGGNSRGENAVDLQLIRAAATQVAKSNFSGILSGRNNRISNVGATAGAGDYSTIAGGSGNIIDTTTNGAYNVIGGGLSNTIPNSSSYATIGGGSGNSGTSSGYAYWTVGGGASNNASSNYATVSGGQSNTASSGTHATVVGGKSTTASNNYAIVGGLNNTSSGFGSVAFGTSTQSTGGRSFAMGEGCTASGDSSVCFGLSNSSTGQYSTAISFYSIAYLYNQFSQGTRFGGSGNTGQSQISNLIASREQALASAATTVLSLDGTGVTNLIIPSGTNRAWNVQVNWVAVVTTITGTATGITVGDVVTSIDLLAFKKIGGVSSASAHTSTATKLMVTTPAAYAACAIAFTAGASQEMELTFTGPTFVGGGSVTMRVVARIELAEVAF